MPNTRTNRGERRRNEPARGLVIIIGQSEHTYFVSSRKTSFSEIHMKEQLQNRVTTILSFLSEKEKRKNLAWGKGRKGNKRQATVF